MTSPTTKGDANGACPRLPLPEAGKGTGGEVPRADFHWKDLLMYLTQAAARTLMLATQGLHQRPAQPATKADVLAAIRRMGALQIDTIHVVARSPYLVIWSRLGDYEPRWLDELLVEGALFEHWAHEACFLPIEDYPLYRRFMRDRWALSRAWIDAHPEDASRMLAFIREHGPVRSADFTRTDGQVSGWWNWKPEKQALERLLATGDLMVARRHNFQRIYDLRERVYPLADTLAIPPYEEVQRALALKAVRALGITPARWLPDYFRTEKRGIDALLEALVDEGAVHRVQVEGWDVPAYIHRDAVELAEAAAAGARRPELTTLLSPFDPLVWDRKRTRALFGFDYTIECYTPAPKRRYGYFTLPILARGALVGRLDPKAHRKEGRFEVKALHLEPNVPITEELISDIAAALHACAAWHKTPEVVVRWSDPPELAALVQRLC
jgi:uncharacterized protein YcaQ